MTFICHPSEQQGSFGAGTGGFFGVAQGHGDIGAGPGSLLGGQNLAVPGAVGFLCLWALRASVLFPENATECLQLLGTTVWN